MHGLIRDRLEEYLGGGPEKKVPLEFEQHLRECDECREEVSWMQDQSHILRALSGPKRWTRAPGFYARVLNRIEAQQSASIWSVFLDPIFGRRLVATSLTVAVLLGGFVAFLDPIFGRRLRRDLAHTGCPAGGYVAFREVANPPSVNDAEAIIAVLRSIPLDWGRTGSVTVTRFWSRWQLTATRHR